MDGPPELLQAARGQLDQLSMRSIHQSVELATSPSDRDDELAADRLEQPAEGLE